MTTADAVRATAAPDICITRGRCRSGRRWFWFAAELYADVPHKCDDPICVYGGPHEHGWEDAEESALAAMRTAVISLGGEPAPVDWRGRPDRQVGAGSAAAALKRINAARRRARPPKPGASAAAPVEHLYQPWSWTDDYGETRRGITEIPIVRKTAKRIYYDATDSWDRHEGTVTLGYVSREELEADNRCRAACQRDIPAGPVCVAHGRDFAHCVHWGDGDWWQRRQCARDGGCGADCWHRAPGLKCSEHGYTWDHCPHGREGDCWHGNAPGEINAPSSRRNLGGRFFTTREAAEAELQGPDRGLPEADLRVLRKAMADAHPDRGGTRETFTAAHERYQEALAATRRRQS